MHNAQAIGQFAFVVGVLLGILINVFFVWLALLISGLRAGFGGKLLIAAAGVVPLQLFPGLWGLIASLVLIAYFVRSVTDAEGWAGVLKYLGAQVLIGVVVLAILVKVIFGSFDFTKAIEKSKNPGAFQKPVNEQPVAPDRNSDESEPSTQKKTYGLTPEELAEVERQVKAPLDEFRKR